MKRFLIFLCLPLFIFFIVLCQGKMVYADELTDEINSQIENIDLTKIEELFNENDYSFMDSLYKVINGDYSFEYSNIFYFFREIFFSSLNNLFPYFVSVLAICFIFTLIKCLIGEKSTKVYETINFVVTLFIITILSTNLISILKDVIEIVNKILDINEIASPIMLSLMIATGGTSSASVYTPTTIFISSFISNVLIKIIIPAIIILFVVVICSNFTNLINIKNLEELFSSLIKWFIGIFSILFTLILSISGITANISDGINIKATKYLLQNSLPIISGIINSGFDFVLASGLIIKNAIGLNLIFLIISLMIQPLIMIGISSLFLKSLSIIIQPLTDIKVENFCLSLSKILTYLAVVVIIASLLLIVYFFLLIISANAFI